MSERYAFPDVVILRDGGLAVVLEAPALQPGDVLVLVWNRRRLRWSQMPRLREHIDRAATAIECGAPARDIEAATVTRSPSLT